MSADLSKPIWHDARFRTLMLFNFSSSASICITLTAIPLWAVNNGLDASSAGLTVSLLLVGTLITQPLVPALLARVDPAMALAGGLVAVALPAIGYALTSELWALCAVGIVRGCGLGVVTVTGTALAMTSASKQRGGELAGFYGLSGTLPSLIGTAAGAALVQAGLFNVVIAVAIAPLLVAPTAFRLRRTEAHLPSPGDEGRRPPFLTTLRAVRLPLIVLLAVMLADGGIITYLPIAQPTGHLASSGLLVLGIAGMLARWGSGRVLDRRGPRILMPALTAAAAAGVFLLAQGVEGGDAVAAALLLGGAALFGAANGALQTLAIAATFTHVAHHQSRTASVLVNVSIDGGMAAGAAFVGVLAATDLQISGAFNLIGLLIALSVPVAVAAGAVRTGRRALPAPP